MARFDWSSIGPVGAVLLDIDLYQPTLSVVEEICPNLAQGGGIVLDDCIDGTPFDGGFEALRDFVAAQGIEAEVIGYKGPILRAPAPTVRENDCALGEAQGDLPARPGPAQNRSSGSAGAVCRQ